MKDHTPKLYAVVSPSEYLEFFWSEEKAENALSKHLKNSYGDKVWVEEVEVTK